MFLPQRVTLLYDLFMILPQWVTFYITCLCFCHSGVRSKLIFLCLCFSGLRSILFLFTHTHTPYVSVKYKYSIRGGVRCGGIRCTGPGSVLFKDLIASPSSRNITQSFNIQYTVFKLKSRVVFIRRKDFE